MPLYKTAFGLLAVALWSSFIVADRDADARITGMLYGLFGLATGWVFL